MTTHLPSPLHLSLTPVADPAAIVATTTARFTVLTDRLIRLEYSSTGQFEDHASQAFWFRKQHVPEFDLTQTAEKIIIETEYLRLEYLAGRALSGKSLNIQVKSTGVQWHYGDIYWSSGQLWGTARTLDGVSGSTGLEFGLMARAGWSVIDDSKSVVFNNEQWAEPRQHPENLDLYFFGYGRDYPACLSDYVKITGVAPMIPRYILGNWWSRYWAYTQAELTGLMSEFEAHEVPLSVCIVDMDWHLTGWTGYTWNRQLWPDPEGFIGWLHAKGLHTALNLHPSDGVGPHEQQYPQMAAAMGIDPVSEEPIKFDIANPQFVQAYFDILHHPYEGMGVDFWWMDWQQERVTRIPGLDPLWWLNHLHYLDLGRNGKRSFIFSRWGGLGNHRYPIGFSGDTHVTWESLAYQPFFTATAANVNYGWWSHDIGGHMSGVEDDELYTRWVQFGVFSPILRLHCTNNPYHERRPWGHGPAAAQATSEAMRLRHQLIPYIYSMAWRNHQQAIPLVTPMYYWNPEDDAAYNAPGQYWFGSELVVAPCTAPADPQVRLSRTRVWLPEAGADNRRLEQPAAGYRNQLAHGTWFNFFTGEPITGGKWQVVYGDLNDIPVFAKAGAIVPLGPKVGWGGIANPEMLFVHVFPGADNRFELYEDDGETSDYTKGAYAITPLRQQWKGNSLTFYIEPATGDTQLIPEKRAYIVLVHSIVQPEDIWLTVNGLPRAVKWIYNAQAEVLTVELGTLRPVDSCELSLGTPQTVLTSARNRRPDTARRLLRALPIDTLLKHSIDRALPDLLAGKLSPRDFDGLSDAQLGALENVFNIDR